jgi:hypothetical protein
MKGSINNIFTYKSLPTQQANLFNQFATMKTSSTDPSFYNIKTWSGDKPLDVIHLHEGLVSSSTIQNIPTLNGHIIATTSKAQASTADDLKESVDQ